MRCSEVKVLVGMGVELSLLLSTTNDQGIDNETVNVMVMIDETAVVGVYAKGRWHSRWQIRNEGSNQVTFPHIKISRPFPLMTSYPSAPHKDMCHVSVISREYKLLKLRSQRVIFLCWCHRRLQA